ncbi:uncharacterized protein BXZ73DRAFT_98856 [Epithele typhae]|uniref:uncharacterized protein n=1 Tax=Epithele typhae TaxID=378194 RepID=UPI0020072EC5|nr:uncharacterized protein BXZ73DRAFT_98856 [Epithele typhae]KAH9940420.1 hypothetical protein BXZ73DRAFT_98856 [Epithele typhae]
MDASSNAAEARATAIAKLKRAASLPRMKDGRRPPMHVEAVSEGERSQGESRSGSEEPRGRAGATDGAVENNAVVENNGEHSQISAPHTEEEHPSEIAEGPQNEDADGDEGDPGAVGIGNAEDTVKTPRKRRSRSRTRSRGSKDFKNKLAKQSPLITFGAESSADEYHNSGPGEDPPPSPPLVSPIPSNIAGFPPSRFLRSPISPVAPLYYPGTNPSTPLPSLDDLQKGVGMGLFRSNSAGAARAMAMSKLTGGTGPFDLSFMASQSPTPASKLMRNNTVAGGERAAVRGMLFQRLGGRINNQTDGEQTSGGEELIQPEATKKKRRRRRNSSRQSAVVDDREDRDTSVTAPTTPSVPSSPLPPFLRQTPEPQRPPSSNGRVVNGESSRAPSRSASRMAVNDGLYNYETPMGHRGVVIEDEDEEAERPLRLPVTPARNFRPVPGLRLPHSSDAPSNASTESAPTPAGAVVVPMFMSNNPSMRGEMFPASPFQTPLKEQEPALPDEEEMPYLDPRSRSRLGPSSAFDRDSEISWVAELVTERPLADDSDDEDEDDEDEDEPQEVEPEEDADESFGEGAEERSSREYEGERPHAPKPLIVDVDTSPDFNPDNDLASPTSPIELNEQPPSAGLPPSPPTYPMRLSVARSPSASADYTDWDDVRAESTPKRPGESISTWEKMKNTFTRSGSTGGRRSRTNSLNARERRYNTDSSVSRESGASLNSGKDAVKSDSPNAGVFAMLQSQPPVMQSNSASASAQSLPPLSAPAGSVPPPAPSPLPLPSSADYLKYQDSKLFPFPALKQLIPASASSPDITSPTMGFPIPLEVAASNSTTGSAITTRGGEGSRERKLSHQASDSRLWASSKQIASVPSNSSQTDYFNTSSSTGSTALAISPSSSGSKGKLPTDRGGVREWLSKFGRSRPTTPGTPTTPLPLVGLPMQQMDLPPRLDKKPSLTDLLMQRKDSELTSQSWSSDASRTPTNAMSGQRLGSHQQGSSVQEPASYSNSRSTEALSPSSAAAPRQDVENTSSLAYALGLTSPTFVPPHSPSPGFPSPPDPPSSTTPDPQSSLDDFPTRSTSESFSSSSHHTPEPPSSGPSISSIVMERLEEILGRGSKSAIWPSAIDDPPRRLVMSSPVLQVANANTIKDRFLFLFTDILIIAKPIIGDGDALVDSTSRKVVVKSVVQLKELRFSSDRDDGRVKTGANSNAMRHPNVREFVQTFSKDPEHAVATLQAKTGSRDEAAIGQLLFRAADIDKARLGEYLSRRSCKAALRAFVDNFGLIGLRIDKALRVFLQSLHIPSRSSAGYSTALEYLLDSFSSRWYEANATVVAHDKDLAIRLVRAIVQLNEVLHGGIAHEPGATHYPMRNVIPRDFVDAFKRFDPRRLVSEEVLNKIYASIRREKLFMARPPASVATEPDIDVYIKRPLPPRLTYRMQSEPVVLRIPRPDPDLTIHLFGQDIVFDPPTLTFARSPEASFRVTGTALGAKSIVMWRAGPNGLAYAGLPLSSPVVVERSFMRNTFQVAFMNHTGLKRRYMFSVDDSTIRQSWTDALRIQVGQATAQRSPLNSRAAQALAFKVLQDTLIGAEDGSAAYSVPYPSAVDQALTRLNGGRSRSGSVNSMLARNGSRRVDPGSAHARSKSRSQLYRQNAAGRMESELDEDEPSLSGGTPGSEGRVWSSHDLQVICRQNSSIPAVLAHLLGGLEGNGHTNGNGHGFAT